VDFSTLNASLTARARPGSSTYDAISMMARSDVVVGMPSTVIVLPSRVTLR
jgi:hypothetical protein